MHIQVAALTQGICRWLNMYLCHPMCACANTMHLLHHTNPFKLHGLIDPIVDIKCCGSKRKRWLLNHHRLTNGNPNKNSWTAIEIQGFVAAADAADGVCQWFMARRAIPLIVNKQRLVICVCFLSFYDDRSNIRFICHTHLRFICHGRD